MDAAAAAAPDVRLCGYLRKQKSQRRRFFVLRAASDGGPARLEYYESEKKFRAAARPKRSLPLAEALNVSKRADARHRHLVVLYGRGGGFGLAAESAEQQQRWFDALAELHGRGRASETAPGPSFKEIWQVTLRPRGLGHSRNLAGVYLLCLTERTISFVRLNSDVAAVVLQLLNVRRCGHSENYFFMEVGRSAVTGPGELWMQVEDLVVAQNMHETILEAMKALSEDFRIRTKSQSLTSTPISVPPRRQNLHNPPPPAQGVLPWRPRSEVGGSSRRSPGGSGQKVPGPRKPDSLSDYSAVSSDEGGSSPGESQPLGTPDPLSYMLDYISMGKLTPADGHSLSKWASEPNKRASLPPMVLGNDAPVLAYQRPPRKPGLVSASYPEGLNLYSTDPGYMAMLPGVTTASAEDQDYVPMIPGSASPPRENGGYMLMSPSGSCSPDGVGQWVSSGGESKSLSSEYMAMSPVSRSASSTPPEYSPLLAIPGGAAFRSLPRSYKHPSAPRPCTFHTDRLSYSSSTSSESLEELGLGFPLHLHAEPPSRGRGDASVLWGSGEYVSINYHARGTAYINVEGQARAAGLARRAALENYAEMASGGQLAHVNPQGRLRGCPETFPQQAEGGGTLPREDQAEPGLNYIDLDLANEAAPLVLRPQAAPGQAATLHSYASIDFHRSGELHGAGSSSEGAES